jgi:hypothetical protein
VDLCCLVVLPRLQAVHSLHHLFTSLAAPFHTNQDVRSRLVARIPGWARLWTALKPPVCPPPELKALLGLRRCHTRGRHHVQALAAPEAKEIERYAGFHCTPPDAQPWWRNPPVERFARRWASCRRRSWQPATRWALLRWPGDRRAGANQSRGIAGGAGQSVRYQIVFTADMANITGKLCYIGEVAALTSRLWF